MEPLVITLSAGTIAVILVVVFCLQLRSIADHLAIMTDQLNQMSDNLRLLAKILEKEDERQGIH